jgi:hypothetical protein
LSAVAIADAPTRQPLDVTRYLPLPTPALEALAAELEAELAEHRAVARELHAEIVAHVQRARALREELEAAFVDEVLGLR